MKNFIYKTLPAIVMASLFPLANSCDFLEDNSSKEESQIAAIKADESFETTTAEGVCNLLSGLSLSSQQLQEVHDAVSRSIDNGYDEEYTFRNIVDNPGFGTGDELLSTRSVIEYPTPLRSLVDQALESEAQTRSTGILEEIAESGLQIYWPYSENWDGKSLPTITFDPEDGAESNTGYLREQLPSGDWITKEVMVDETYSVDHPVWIVNRNNDCGHFTPEILRAICPEAVQTKADTDFKTLRLKEFKAHRNYDGFLAGGSEFLIKCGSIKAFTATVVEDLTRYSPEITDLVINVKRKQIGKTLRYNTVLASEWTSQLEECAFLMNEDDGGKRTTWKCSGTVKIKSKSYGFEVEFPLNINDDIVWRGKLSAGYFTKYDGKPNRLGDVSVTFTLD